MGAQALRPGLLLLVCQGAGGRTPRTRNEQLSPDVLRKTAGDELIALLPVLRRLPRRIDRIGGALEAGRLSINVRLLADPADRRYLTNVLHQIILTALAATSGIMAVIMLGLHGGPSITGSSQPLRVLRILPCSSSPRFSPFASWSPSSARHPMTRIVIAPTIGARVGITGLTPRRH